MDGIWRPGGIWAKFISKPEDENQKKPLRWLRLLIFGRTQLKISP
jgi:hypothetical protein